MSRWAVSVGDVVQDKTLTKFEFVLSANTSLSYDGWQSGWDYGYLQTEI